jgi:hypothetical protein
MDVKVASWPSLHWLALWVAPLLCPHSE